MRKLLFPLVFGLVGIAILMGLGFWQVGRLAQKEAYLAAIHARITEEPVAIPEVPDPDRDRFLAVAVSGRYSGNRLDVLTGRKGAGAQFRVISDFETESGRRILVDRGFVTQEQRGMVSLDGDATLIGNLHWPDEIDSFTPPPDTKKNIWFARDVTGMAAALGTEPVFLVLRETTEPNPVAVAFPVTTTSIPNNHLGYAIQWFGLAIVWFGMTLYLLWRINRRTA